MKPRTPENSIQIGDRLVPWSFVYRVNRLCGGDWDDTIDCFWKARHATGKNGIERYIMCGLKPRRVNGQPALPFMLLPSREREHGQMNYLRDWWETLYERRKKPDAELAKRTDEIMRHVINKFTAVI